MKLIMLLIIILSLFLLYLLIPFFEIIFTGLLISYLVKPAVNRLNLLIKHNTLSCLIATIISVLASVSIFYLLTRVIIFSFIQLQSILDLNIVFLNNMLLNYGTNLLITSNPTHFISMVESIFSITPKLILDILLLSFLIFYSLRDSFKIREVITRSLNYESRKKLLHFTRRANYIFNNLIWEYLFVGILIGLVILVSLSFLRIGFAVELSTIAFIISMLPVISGWIVTAALSIYYYFTDNLFNALILMLISIPLFFTAYYAHKIFSVEKGINPLLLILGLFSGVLSFGLIGFIAGPIIAGLLQAGYETIFQQY